VYHKRRKTARWERNMEKAKSSDNELDHKIFYRGLVMPMAEDIEEILSLPLSTRTKNCLLRGGIRSLDEIIRIFNDNSIWKLRNFGSVTHLEIEKLIKNEEIEKYRRKTKSLIPNKNNHQYYGNQKTSALLLSIKTKNCLIQGEIKSFNELIKKYYDNSIWELEGYDELIHREISNFFHKGKFDNLLKDPEPLGFKKEGQYQDVFNEVLILPLSIRTIRCLIRGGIRSIDDLVQRYKDNSIWALHMFGEKTYKEIEELIKKGDLEKYQNRKRINSQIEKVAEKKIPTLSDLIHSIFIAFAERDLQIFFDRYFEKMTLQAVSDNFGITRERIRQIEVRIIRKIRKRILLHFPDICEYINLANRIKKEFTISKWEKKIIEESLIGFYSSDTNELIRGISPFLLFIKLIRIASRDKELSKIFLLPKQLEQLIDIEQKKFNYGGRTNN